MFTTFEFIVIQLADPLGEFDGYVVRDVIGEKYNIAGRIHYVDESQVIISIPQEYGVDLGFCMNELVATVNNIAKATIYTVAVDVDFANKTITSIIIHPERNWTNG